MLTSQWFAVIAGSRERVGMKCLGLYFETNCGSREEIEDRYVGNNIRLFAWEERESQRR